MQQTAVRTRSREQAAHRVSRKILGDLENLFDWYAMESPDYFRRLRHDLELGLLHGALRSFEFVLYRNGESEPYEILEYPVDQGGGPNDRSGRIPYDPALDEGHFRVIVHGNQYWEELKAQGRLNIVWSPCAGASRLGLQGRADGGYCSDRIGVRRVHYRRRAGF